MSKINNPNTGTVEIDLPRIPKLLANYLEWISQQEDVIIFDVLNIDSISKYFSSLMFYETKDESILKNYIFKNSETVTRAFLDGYIVEKHNYIEIVEELNWDTDLSNIIPEYVIFLGKEPETQDSFEALKSLYYWENNINITQEEALLLTIDTEKDQEKFYKIFIDLHPEFKDTHLDFFDIASNFTMELFDLAMPNNIYKMFKKYDIFIGTVGHENWSYYAALNKYHNQKEILDIWEGDNFYTVKRLDVDDDGLFIGYAEEIHFVYAPNTDDLINKIKELFELDKSDIFLIENDITKTLTDIKKLTVKETIYIEEK